MNLKKFPLILSLVAITGTASAAPVLIGCRSSVTTEHSYSDYTFQIDGTIDGEVLKKAKFTVIHVWDENEKPLVIRNTFTKDESYKPRADKYKNYNRYEIQKNTPDAVGYSVLLPTEAKIWELAKQQAEDGDDLVQAQFSGVLRYEEDYSQDIGGQVTLNCETGWLKVK